MSPRRTEGESEERKEAAIEGKRARLHDKMQRGGGKKGEADI